MLPPAPLTMRNLGPAFRIDMFICPGLRAIVLLAATTCVHAKVLPRDLREVVWGTSLRSPDRTRQRARSIAWEVDLPCHGFGPKPWILKLGIGP